MCGLHGSLINLVIFRMNNNPFYLTDESGQLKSFSSLESGIHDGLCELIEMVKGSEQWPSPRNTIAKLIGARSVIGNGSITDESSFVSVLSGIDENAIIYPDNIKQMCAIGHAIVLFESGMDLSLSVFKSAFKLI